MQLNPNDIYWKIMIQDDQGNLKNLFHGLNGSKTLPKHQWLTAIEKPVIDGTRGTEYLSGFHILKSYCATVTYLNSNFKKPLNRIIVPCIARDIRPKSHSRNPVFLAKYIKLI
jgi:hypothetical protein